MAKRGTLDHPKTLKLARRLGIPACYALGVLESLWHWVGQYAKDGDITGIERWQIAEAIRYPGSEDELFACLIECGLVDEIEGRTLIHDWSEHADNSVKKTLANNGRSFADGNKPFQKNKAKVQNHENVIHEKDADFQENSGKGDDISGKTGHISSLPEPEPEPEPLSPSKVSPSAVELADYWDQFVSAYPKRSGSLNKAEAEKKFKALLKSGIDPEVIISGVKRYREWADATGVSGTQLVRQMTTWIHQKTWLEDFEIPNSDADEVPKAGSRESLLAAVGL